MTNHLEHPQWEELEKICRQIEHLKYEAEKLRNKIDEDCKKCQKQWINS